MKKTAWRSLYGQNSKGLTESGPYGQTHDRKYRGHENSPAGFFFCLSIAALLFAPGVATPAWLVLLTFGITSFQLLKHDHPSETAADKPADLESGFSEITRLPEKAPD